MELSSVGITLPPSKRNGSWASASPAAGSMRRIKARLLTLTPGRAAGTTTGVRRALIFWFCRSITAASKCLDFVGCCFDRKITAEAAHAFAMFVFEEHHERQVGSKALLVPIFG